MATRAKLDLDAKEEIVNSMKTNIGIAYLLQVFQFCDSAPLIN